MVGAMSPSTPSPRRPKTRKRLVWVALVLGAIIAIPRLGEAQPPADETAAPAAPVVTATQSAEPTSEAPPSTTAEVTAPVPTPTSTSPATSAKTSEEAGTPTGGTKTAATRRPSTAGAATALAAAATLQVKGRAPKTGYDRAQFGQAWLDTDRNGCDTRNDVLRRDLENYVLKAGTRGCLVLRGTLHDPYTGSTIAFVRGQTTSTAVQVDHVVALADAWQKGAQQWTATRRATFANDPLNLLAVDGPANMSKGAGDTATWLPPNKSYRCRYVARQVAVKASYQLWVTAAERDAMVRVLQTCPDEPLPQAGGFRLGGGREEAAPKPAPKPAPSPSKPATKPAPIVGSPKTDPRFGTCKEAKAAGYGPYRSGVDPEYDWYRDRDKDGVVCE
jgi:hypothetical protein